MNTQNFLNFEWKKKFNVSNQALWQCEPITVIKNIHRDDTKFNVDRFLSVAQKGQRPDYDSSHIIIAHVSDQES